MVLRGIGTPRRKSLCRDAGILVLLLTLCIEILASFISLLTL